MPRPTRKLFTSAAMAVASATASFATTSLLVPTTPALAQASPYLPLDDPRLALIEHLIARGDIADPSPMMRPFRQLDAAHVLRAADSTTPGSSGALIRTLRAQFEPPPADASGTVPNTWSVGARAGGQAFSHIRRDVLHPLGPDGARPYADFAGTATMGNIAIASRLAAEPRIADDPEWPGRHDLALAWRALDAYASGQFKYASVFYGQLDRNWGPVGVPGIGLSNYNYAEVETAITLGTRDLSLTATARQLTDAQDSDGNIIHRYFFAHRLSARLSDRVTVGVWETTLLPGQDREFDGRYRNPFTLLLFTNQYGLGSNGNVMLGLDAHWRASRRTTVQAQLGLDDLQYEHTTGATRYPNRWGLTLTAFGALGPTASWRALYTQASSLAFRTLNPFENFTDHGVGIGRNFDDNDQLTFTLGLPVRSRWLLTPEATLLRQGQGQINDPFPTSPAEAGQLPSLFIGTMERTWRLALGAVGQEGPFALSANAGYHHVVNADHERGRTADRFEGRLQATIGFMTGGTLR